MKKNLSSLSSRIPGIRIAESNSNVPQSLSSPASRPQNPGIHIADSDTKNPQSSCNQLNRDSTAVQVSAQVHFMKNDYTQYHDFSSGMKQVQSEPNLHSMNEARRPLITINDKRFELQVEEIVETPEPCDCVIEKPWRLKSPQERQMAIAMRTGDVKRTPSTGITQATSSEEIDYELEELAIMEFEQIIPLLRKKPRRIPTQFEVWFARTFTPRRVLCAAIILTLMAAALTATYFAIAATIAYINRPTTTTPKPPTTPSTPSTPSTSTTTPSTSTTTPRPTTPTTTTTSTTRSTTTIQPHTDPPRAIMLQFSPVVLHEPEGCTQTLEAVCYSIYYNSAYTAYRSFNSICSADWMKRVGIESKAWTYHKKGACGYPVHVKPAKESVCGRYFQPVCCYDGRTYWNECYCLKSYHPAFCPKVYKQGVCR